MTSRCQSSWPFFLPSEGSSKTWWGFVAPSVIQTSLGELVARHETRVGPPGVLPVRVRPRLFRQESFGRRCLDEFRRTDSLTDHLPRPAAGTAQASIRSLQLDQRTSSQTRKCNRQRHSWVTAFPRLRRAHLDFALSLYR